MFMDKSEKIWGDVEITRDISGILLIEAIEKKLGPDYFKDLQEGLKTLDLEFGGQGDSAIYADRKELLNLLNETHAFLPNIEKIIPGISDYDSSVSSFGKDEVIVGTINTSKKTTLFNKIKDAFITGLTAYSLGSNKSFKESLEIYRSICVSPIITNKTADDVSKIYSDLKSGLAKLEDITRLPDNFSLKA